MRDHMPRGGHMGRQLDNLSITDTRAAGREEDLCASIRTTHHPQSDSEWEAWTCRHGSHAGATGVVEHRRLWSGNARSGSDGWIRGCCYGWRGPNGGILERHGAFLRQWPECLQSRHRVGILQS
jgi:hypothetical protein